MMTRQVSSHHDQISSKAVAFFWGAQDKFDKVNWGGGFVGEIGKHRGEGGVNCGNIGEGSWVRDFP